MKEHDPVNSPSHYTQHPFDLECIDVIENMPFCRGSAIKYIWRAGDKNDEIEDLEKSLWFIQREISRIGRLRARKAGAPKARKKRGTLETTEKAFKRSLDVLMDPTNSILRAYEEVYEAASEKLKATFVPLGAIAKVLGVTHNHLKTYIRLHKSSTYLRYAPSCPDGCPYVALYRAGAYTTDQSEEQCEK